MDIISYSKAAEALTKAETVAFDLSQLPAIPTIPEGTVFSKEEFTTDLKQKLDNIIPTELVIDCGNASSQFDTTTLILDGGNASG